MDKIGVSLSAVSLGRLSSLSRSALCANAPATFQDVNSYLIELLVQPFLLRKLVLFWPDALDNIFAEILRF